MDWIYCSLVNGRLLDDDGKELNKHFPSFASYEEADAYLVANDIRASIR